MWVEELTDKPVIGIAEGEKLGSVHDVLIDEPSLRLVALIIGGGGLLGGARQAVGYDAVRGIGPDAVMVSGRAAVQEVTRESPLHEALRAGELRQQVMTESGVHLGRVQAAAFDPQTGEISELRLDVSPDAGGAGGDDRTLIARERIVNVTAKLIVVRHAVVAEQPKPALLGRVGSDASAPSPALAAGRAPEHNSADQGTAAAASVRGSVQNAAAVPQPATAQTAEPQLIPSNSRAHAETLPVPIVPGPEDDGTTQSEDRSPAARRPSVTEVLPAAHSTGEATAQPNLQPEALPERPAGGIA